MPYRGDVIWPAQDAVSRRDPRRRGADVWTSGNRLFATDDPELVIDAALVLGGEYKGSGAQPPLWRSIAERDAIVRIGDALRAMAAQEAAEERATLSRGGQILY